MDASLEERMLRLAQELAISHGTFFAAALLADMNIPMPLALAALARPAYASNFMGSEDILIEDTDRCGGGSGN